MGRARFRTSGRAADDDEEPTTLPSWFPEAASQGRRLPRGLSRRERVLAWLLLGLGCVGVAIGFLAPGTSTEVVLGGFLLILGLRALTSVREP